MRAVWILFVACGLAGCDLIYELDDPQQAEPVEVAVELTRQHLANAADGTPALFPDPASLDGVSVRLSDGTVPDLELDSVGRITFAGYRDDPYQLTYQLAGETVTVRTQHDTPRFDATEFGRLDRASFTPDTNVFFGNLDTGNVFRHRIMSSGVWANLTGPTPPMTNFLAKWTSALPFEGARALVEASKNDVLYLGTYVFEGTHSPPYERLNALRTEALEMVAGTDNAYPTGTSATVALDCNTLFADVPAIEERLMEFAAYDQRTVFVTTLAAPSPETHPLRGFILATGSTNVGDSISVSMNHAEPNTFPGYATLARVDVIRERMATGPGGPITLGIQSSHVAVMVEDDNTCPANDLFSLEHRVAVPMGLALDDLPLSEDDTIIAIESTGHLRLEWGTLGDRVDAFIIVLVKLEAGSGETLPRRIQTYRTRETRLDIDPDLLETNGTYLISIAAVSGMPGASEGDFAKISYPYDFTSTNSSTFKILRD